MPLLTDTDLKEIICAESVRTDGRKLHIYPFSDDSLTPVGYDLRVGSRYSSALRAGTFTIAAGGQVTIGPGDTVLITTLEKVGMPKDKTLSALIVSKVSKVSRGLSHIATTIDPDWDGLLLIAVHNHSRRAVELSFAEPFCTAVFLENRSPATRDCGKQSGRLDMLLRQWDDITLGVLKKRVARRLIPIAIIIFVGSLGYWFFGNSPGFAAVTAGGVAISQAAMLLMERH